MKKVLTIVFLMIILVLCIKSSLQIGTKESLIDVMNFKQQTKNNTTFFDSDNEIYYTSTEKPTYNTSVIYSKEQLTNSPMLLLNKDSMIKNEQLTAIMKDCNFETDTMLLLQYKENPHSNIGKVTNSSLNLKEVAFNIEVQDKKNKDTYNYVILTLKNLKVKNLKYFNITYSKY